MNYQCFNCNNKAAKSIKFNVVELDELQIMKNLVNNSELSITDIGHIVVSLFASDNYEDEK